MADEKEKPQQEDFPSNSLKNKLEITGGSDVDQPTVKLKKVIQGGITKKKKSLADRFSETFFGDDAGSVGRYLVWDVLIPAAKDTIVDMVKGGIEMLLYGENKSDRLHREKGRSYVSYSSIYGSRDRERERDRDRRAEPRSRAIHKFDDVIFDTRGDAEEVLTTLIDMIDEYGAASVADFYDACGLTAEFTDNKYGWDNLSRSTVEHVRQGYILVMPKTIQLD
jgi:hypothetical protein